MLFREHLIPPRFFWVFTQILRRLQRLDLFDFIVVIGVFCFLPVNLFSFLFVSDALLLFFAFAIIPYGIKRNKNFYFAKEHILIAAYAVWAYGTYLLNPSHESVFIC